MAKKEKQVKATEVKTETEAKEKKPSKAAQILAEQVAQKVEGLIEIDIEPYGGLTPEQMAEPVKKGVVYYLDESQLNLDLDANGRLFYDEDAMAHVLTVDGRVHNALITEVPSGTTLDDLISGKLKALTLEGHRRTLGTRLLRDNVDKVEFYQKNFEKRIPVMFEMDLTESQRESFRKDQTSQRGIELPEFYLQNIQLIRLGYKEREVVERLFGLYHLTSSDTKNYDKALVEFKIDKDEAKLWKVKHSMCYGRYQTAQAFAALPNEIFQHYCWQQMPKLAAKDGIKIDARITPDDVRELAKLKNEAVKAGVTREVYNPQIMARFEEILQNYRDKHAPAGGDGEGGDTLPIGRSLSKAEIEQQLSFFESDTIQCVMKGCSGDREARKRWPELDGILTKFEEARATRGKVMDAFLVDPQGFCTMLADRGIVI